MLNDKNSGCIQIYFVNQETLSEQNLVTKTQYRLIKYIFLNNHNIIKINFENVKNILENFPNIAEKYI